MHFKLLLTLLCHLNKEIKCPKQTCSVQMLDFKQQYKFLHCLCLLQVQSLCVMKSRVRGGHI
jgi:hypothetical protein